jgi:alpha-1,3-glucosyltransferase
MGILLQPSLILIDNGHFQRVYFSVLYKCMWEADDFRYNSVLLGLSLFSLSCLRRDRDVLGCVAFSLALCFKQMGLYYAPAIGCYLLAKCFWLGGREG